MISRLLYTLGTWRDINLTCYTKSLQYPVKIHATIDFYDAHGPVLNNAFYLLFRYKERLYTKYIKSLGPRDTSKFLTGRNWTFLKDGLDDFRDGLPPPVEGGMVLQVNEKLCQANFGKLRMCYHISLRPSDTYMHQWTRPSLVQIYNGLSPGWCQAIIWTSDGMLLIGPLETNFSEFFI